MDCSSDRGLWTVALLAVILTGGLLASCTERPTEAPILEVAKVIRAYPGGCVPQVIESSDDSTETVRVTFTTGPDNCFPDLVQWGIDMADPLPVDTPQQAAAWSVRGDLDASGMPSPVHVATFGFTPPQSFIEIDPPARRVRFYYSRLLQQRAIWGTQVDSDSMRVQALSRTPGTLSYQYWDEKIIYSNVGSTAPPWTQWTQVELAAPGDLIEWVQFDGHLVIDDLEVVRGNSSGALIVTLNCSFQPIARALELTCGASANTTDPITYSWVFHPDSVQIFPFGPKDPVGDSITAGNITSWVGPMVVPGTIILSGATAIESAADTVHIAVLDRPHPQWDSTAPGDAQDVTGLWGPHPNQDPATPVFLGENVGIHNQALLPGFLLDIDTTWVTVSSGPNTGYRYLDTIPFSSTRGYRVNMHLTNRGTRHDQDFTAQPNGRNLRNATHNRAAQRHNTSQDALFDGVVRHETTGTGGTPGHQSAIKTAMRGSTCGNANMLAERVAGSPSRTASLIGFVKSEAESFVEKEAVDHVVVTGHYANVTVVAGAVLFPLDGPHIIGMASDTDTDTMRVHSIGCN